jgi:hypothetical protein
MNFLKDFDSLNEAVALSVAKPYVQAWTETGGRERYKEWFGGKWRIYLEFVKESEVYQEVRDILFDNGYDIVSYKGNRATKFGENRNHTSIGKLLNRFSPELRTKYDLDKDKVDDNSEYIIVISRHPYDIIGMTTNRQWNSCMNVIIGQNRRYLIHDVKEGTLVSYIIKRDDTNINQPIGRMLIKPFKSNSNKIMLGTESKVYGKDVVGFKDTVDSWLKEKQGSVDDDYRLIPTLYPDGRTMMSNDQYLEYIAKKYDYYRVIEKDYILVKKDYLTGIVDSKAKVIIPVKYERFTIMHNGIIVCDENSKWGILNKDGSVILPLEYNSVDSVVDREGLFREDNAYDNFYLVRKNNKSAILNISNPNDAVYYDRIRQHNHHDDPRHDTNTVLSFMDNSMYGILSQSGEVLLEPQSTKIDSISNFGKDLVSVKSGSNIFIFNYTTLTKSPIYEYVSRSGVAIQLIVYANERYSVVSTKTFEVIIPPQFIDIKLHGGFKYVVRGEDGYYGLYNHKGEILLPVEFLDINVTYNGYSEFIHKDRRTGKYSGNEIIWDE